MAKKLESEKPENADEETQSPDTTADDAINLRIIAERRGLIEEQDSDEIIDDTVVPDQSDESLDDLDDEDADSDASEDEEETESEDDTEKSTGCDLDGQVLKRYCEAVLFRSPASVKPQRIAKIIGHNARTGDINRALKALKEEYDELKLSFEVVQLAGGWQLLSRPEYSEIIEKMVVHREVKKLTPTMLEALAIIAFKQPLTRQEVDDVRGVDSSGVLRSLMDRGLLISGRDYDKLGKPIVYATTQRFLQVFGLRSLKDLPKAVEFRGIGNE